MVHLFTYAITVFTGFFAIMNPIANAPIFVGLVADVDGATKVKIARKAAVVAFLIVAAFIIGGKYIFEVFGIGIPAFKIAGGILIFYVGFEMLMSQKSKIHTATSSEDDNVAISPLAIPILAGPGTIVTAMNYVSDADLTRIIIVSIISALMIFLNYAAFTMSDWIIGKLGSSLISVIGKLMGLILTIIGVEMVAQGVQIISAGH